MKVGQRRRTVELLGEGATLRECAAMTFVPWPAFSDYWSTGRKDHEEGRRSAAGMFYRDAQATRARFRSVTRALANAAAGTREAADRLALLARLDAEAEPEVRDEEMDAMTRSLNEQILADPEAREHANALLRRLCQLDEALRAARS